MTFPGILSLSEDDDFYFDAEAADEIIRFAQKFPRHHKGEFVGQLFRLEEIQRRILSDIYGYRSRATGLRRFSKVWWEGPVGCGKSPILAISGLCEMMSEREPGAEIYSCASCYSEARVVFDTAKAMIEMDPELDRRLVRTKYEIRHRDSRNKSFWRIVSGKGPGAGTSPQLVLADEIHSWKSRDVYDALQGRMNKRRQPILFCATNAGDSKQSIWWELHEEAREVLEGQKKNKALYPIIWQAPKDSDPGAPETWRIANPLLGVTISEAKIRDDWEKAKGNPALEARFRRLNLTQLVQNVNKWIDLAVFDSATKPFDRETVKDSAVYIGVDLSKNDDLSAVEYAYVKDGHIYVESDFWIPKPTADYYHDHDGIKYREWAGKGHITLVNEPTISPAVKRSIAQKIIDFSTKYSVKAVLYDRAYSDDCIAALETAGIVCIPIAQGYSVSPGCFELDRRMKEKSITIAPNPVLRMNAENVEVKFDDRGNFWPVKPGATNKGFAGYRSKKIDGIQALVTALTEARRHEFAQPKKTIGAWII